LEAKWTRKDGHQYCTPAFYKDTLLGYYQKGKNSYLFAAELETGTVSKEVMVDAGERCNSPAVADGRLWAGPFDYIIAAPESPDFMKKINGGGWYDKALKANPLSRDPWASCSVWKGRVFARHGNKIHCVDFRKEAEGDN
jgi:hypothetical protein